VHNQSRQAKPFTNFNPGGLKFGQTAVQPNKNQNLFSGISAFNNSNQGGQGNIFTNQKQGGAMQGGNIFTNNQTKQFSKVNQFGNNKKQENKGGRLGMGFFQNQGGFKGHHMSQKSNPMSFNNMNKFRGNTHQFGQSTTGETKDIFAKSFQEVKNRKMESKLEQARQKKGRGKFRDNERLRRPPNNVRNKERNLNRRKYSSDDYIVMSPKKRGNRISKKKRMRHHRPSVSVKSDSEESLNRKPVDNFDFEMVSKMKNELKAKLKNKKKKKPPSYTLTRVKQDFNIFLTQDEIEKLKKKDSKFASLSNKNKLLFGKIDEAKFSSIKNDIELKIERSKLMKLKEMDQEYAKYLQQLIEVTN
jgi:hypothetical protein